MKYKLSVFYGILFCCTLFCNATFADRGSFDTERWNEMLSNIRTKATEQNISESVIDDTLKNPVFIPGIVKADRNQSEFKLTLEQYLDRTVTKDRINQGIKKRNEYPTLLGNVEKKFGVPRNVILAFWGLESNYGKTKSKYQLTNAFLTLIYDGRREEFFSKQLLSLMKTADKNKLQITNIHGSWAGAMGHFQFIPTTLSQYGMDGNGDNKIDIINSVGDAMYSAANYLNKLGWNKNEKIAQRVIVPADFDHDLLNGDTKKTLTQWAALGVTNADGSLIENNDTMVGLVADTKNIIEQTQPEIESDTDIAPQPVIKAYLTHPNFYRIKKWNNSSWYAIAIAELADSLK